MWEGWTKGRYGNIQDVYMFKLILPTLDKIQMIFKELLVLTSEYIYKYIFYFILQFWHSELS